MYLKLNLNPNDNEADDCIVRAIAFVTQQTWEQVYNELCKIGLEKFEMPSGKVVFEEYLQNRGWINMRRIRRSMSNGKWLTVKEFVEIKKERMIVIVSNHVVACDGGNYYDTFDCGGLTVQGYWVKK